MDDFLTQSHKMMALRIGAGGHNKFVAADAGNQVFRPDRGLHRLCRVDQDGIARRVAKGIVHLFEVVQINVQHRDDPALAVGHMKRPRPIKNAH